MIYLLLLLFFLANFAEIDSRLKALSAVCREALRKQGFADQDIETEAFLHMRYDGTDCALMCPASKSIPNAMTPEHGNFFETFLNRSAFFFLNFF